MFEENEKPVIDEITENVEETTEETTGTEAEPTIEKPVEKVEEPEKLYTEDDFNKKLDEVLAKKIARKEAKIRKEYDSKYGKLENVLRAGTGINGDIEEITDTFNNYYSENVEGYKTPTENRYSERETEILAKAEADDIIESGYDDIVEEVNRLANIGTDKMSAREKLIFSRLASERKRIEDEKDLASIGVTKLDDDFKEFAKDLNPNLSMKEKYEIYTKYKPKTKVETIGSMQTSDPVTEKDYYTPEEVDKLTREELKDPKVMSAVDRSMAKWYENK